MSPEKEPSLPFSSCTLPVAGTDLSTCDTQGKPRDKMPCLSGVSIPGRALNSTKHVRSVPRRPKETVQSRGASDQGGWTLAFEGR